MNKIATTLRLEERKQENLQFRICDSENILHHLLEARIIFLRHVDVIVNPLDPLLIEPAKLLKRSNKYPDFIRTFCVLFGRCQFSSKLGNPTSGETFKTLNG